MASTEEGKEMLMHKNLASSVYLAKLSYFTNLNFPDNKAKPPFGSIWGVKKSANLCLKNLPTKNCVPETGSEFGKGISGKSLEQIAVDT